jgi:hypothetical protein
MHFRIKKNREMAGNPGITLYFSIPNIHLYFAKSGYPKFRKYRKFDCRKRDSLLLPQRSTGLIGFEERVKHMRQQWQHDRHVSALLLLLPAAAATVAAAATSKFLS